MTIPTWAVQSNFIKYDNVEQVARSLQGIGASYKTADVIPFTLDLIEDPQFETQDVIPYGSTTLMRIAQARGWKGLFFNDNFQVDAWVKNRNDMLNQDVQIVTIRDMAAEYLELRGHKESVRFVRPIGDMKLFSGQVMTTTEMADWGAKLLNLDSENKKSNFPTDMMIVNPDSLVAISPVHELQAEWRFFIVGGVAITGSTYRMQGRPHCKHVDEDMLTQANVLAYNWLPHETCVMDVALVGNDFKVIEFNCINASGFYDCDISEIVKEMHDYYDFRGDAHNRLRAIPDRDQ